MSLCGCLASLRGDWRLTWVCSTEFWTATLPAKPGKHFCIPFTSVCRCRGQSADKVNTITREFGSSIIRNHPFYPFTFHSCSHGYWSSAIGCTAFVPQGKSFCNPLIHNLCHFVPLEIRNKLWAIMAIWLQLQRSWFVAWNPVIRDILCLRTSFQTTSFFCDEALQGLGAAHFCQLSQSVKMFRSSKEACVKKFSSSVLPMLASLVKYVLRHKGGILGLKSLGFLTKRVFTLINLQARRKGCCCTFNSCMLWQVRLQRLEQIIHVL